MLAGIYIDEYFVEKMTKNEVEMSRIGSFVIDRLYMSQMKTLDSIGTRSRTWRLWIFISKNIPNSNRVEDYASNDWERDI